MSYDESYWCPIDDGEDFPGSTNCGGEDFGSRLAQNMHFAQAHLGLTPARLALQGSRIPSHWSDYANVMCDLQPFVASEEHGFHGSPVIPNTHGWGMLGVAPGVGLGLPQAVYVIWSQGTPIAWYLNDSTDEGWVFPEGDYFRYDRITSRHQSKIAGALRMMRGEEMETVWPAPWVPALVAAFTPTEV